MPDSDRNWQTWGERDPYYGVLSDPRFRSDSIVANRDAFFDNGEVFVRDIFALLERHFGALQRDRALDFGCGVGRLTIPLARRFGSVVGLDISPAMLAEARSNSDGLAIDYRLSDDALSQVEGSFDFINSCIVFQHIPVARGVPILARLLTRVRSGGGCLIQVSLRRRFGWWKEIGYRIRHHLPGGQMLLNLANGKPADAPVMQMNEYSLPDLLRLFSAHGFGELVTLYGDHGDIDTVIILARKR